VKPRPHLAFAFAGTAALIFACGPRPRGDGMSAGAPQRARAADSDARKAPSISSSLDVRVGDGVRFDFRITNAGGGTVEVRFPSGQTHDIAVLDSLGREVWRWSAGRLFTQALRNRVLHSNDTLAFGERWSVAPRGRYVAVATLASRNLPIERRVGFTVP
jgi:hypothetical protein